jgi:hypothetical protein
VQLQGQGRCCSSVRDQQQGPCDVASRQLGSQFTRSRSCAMDLICTLRALPYGWFRTSARADPCCCFAVVCCCLVLLQAQDHAINTLKDAKAELFGKIIVAAGADDELANAKARVTVLAPTDEVRCLPPSASPPRPAPLTSLQIEIHKRLGSTAVNCSKLGYLRCHAAHTPCRSASRPHACSGCISPPPVSNY